MMKVAIHIVKQEQPAKINVSLGIKYHTAKNKMKISAKF